MDRRHIFTNKKRLKGKKISITESLTKTGMSALKETRNKFGYKSDWKIIYKDEDDTRAKVYFDWYSSKQKFCYGKSRGCFWFNSIILFLFVWGIFYEAFQNTKLLCLFNIVWIKIKFFKWRVSIILWSFSS